MKNIFLLSLVILFSACTSQKSFTLEKPKVRVETFPKMDEIHIKELGNSLFSEFYVEQVEFIILQEIPKTKKVNFQLKDTKFKFQGYEKMGKLYYNKAIEGGVLLTPNNQLIATYQAEINRFAKYSLKEQVDYDFVYEDISAEDNFIQEFLYNGKSGNTLKFTYREYINDIIRPAFTQELQYDFSESDIIGFKNLKIQILEATNTNVTYKVLSGFKNK